MRIGSKIFIVGGIPIAIAAGIALASIALMREADEARGGAALAGIVYRNVLAALTSRDDYLMAGPADRERFRAAFLAQMDLASADLSELRDISQSGEGPAIEQARKTLPRYIASMDRLVAITVRNKDLVTAMSRRASLLISLADQAHERQQAANGDLVALITQGDRKLRAARDILDAAYELRLVVASIQAGQLDLRINAAPDIRAGLGRKLAFDLIRLRHAVAKLAIVLPPSGADAPPDDLTGAARGLQQRLGLLKPFGDADQAVLGWAGDTQQLARDLAAFAERLIKVYAAEYRSEHDQGTQLLTLSVEARETEQATQKIAVEILKLGSRTADALSRRDQADSRSVLDESQALVDTIAALPIAPLIQSAMIDAARDWRAALASATEGLAQQGVIVGSMDRAAGQMTQAAGALDATFTGNAEAIGRSVRTILMLGAGIGLLFGGAAGLLVARSITRPLHRLQIRMMALAKGLGDAAIEDEGRRDEFGDMARAANVFLREITRRESVIRQAKERADQALDRLRQTQAELIQAEKLASLGQLVAGVAHEINTPIGIAVTTSTALENDVTQFRRATAGGKISRSLLEHLAERLSDGTHLISANLLRAADLVQSFKHVAVDQTSGERRRFEVDRWLKDLLTSLGPMLRKSGHSTAMECPPGLVLDTRPGALAQVVTNLIVNASLHAYGPHEAGQIAVAVEAGDGVLRLAIADRGRGILPADRAKIFDPFYTTRRAEGSTGLGLHIVFNLVTSTLGGRIECESEPGRGSRFIIELPCDTALAGSGVERVGGTVTT